MANERAAIKLYIPHPNQPELSICGILEQCTPAQDTRGKKLALVRTAIDLFVHPFQLTLTDHVLIYFDELLSAWGRSAVHHRLRNHASCACPSGHLHI